MIPFPRLLVLTDRSQLAQGRGLIETVAECVAAGLTHVVLRELDLPRGARAELAVECAKAGAQVIAAHERLPGCVGVHLPAGGQPIDGAWGRSCHAPDAVEQAAADGAMWATLSPFAASASKPGYGPALSPGAFAGHAIPVFALGGIEPANAAKALAAGAAGIAVMGAVMRADRPGTVVSALLELLT